MFVRHGRIDFRLALANGEDRPVDVRLIVYDLDGRVLARTNPILPAGRQVEFSQVELTDKGRFKGSIRMVSDTPIAVDGQQVVRTVRNETVVANVPSKSLTSSVDGSNAGPAAVGLAALRRRSADVHARARWVPTTPGRAIRPRLSYVSFSNLKPPLMENAQRVKDRALAMATRYHRLYLYLHGKVRMEDSAKEMAKRDGITEGLVCIFSIVQPGRSFAFRFEKGRPFVQSAKRKCLHLYFYFMDGEFGLMHVQLQTWFPMRIQVYLNGHEWLARKLAANRPLESVGLTT